jgi:hypothetical protein
MQRSSQAGVLMGDKPKPEAPAILRGPNIGTNLIKGRDVRFLLQNRNIDPNLVEVIAKIAEVNHTNTLAIAELATLLDNIIEYMQGFSECSGQYERYDRAVQARHGGELK